MSKFDIINKTKEEFSENLNKHFKKTKIALSNFDEFMSDNPKFVAGLASATIVVTSALGYDVYQSNQSVSLEMYNTSQVAQVKNRSDAMTEEFLRVPFDAAKISNIDLKTTQLDFTHDTHRLIKELPEKEGIAFKNPFWPTNILTVYNKPNESSQYHHDILKNTIIDKSDHNLDMDYNQTKRIGQSMGVTPDKQHLVDSYTFYHEAAHASYAQSIPYAGTTTNRIDNELMSDISSLVYIGHQNKKDFDYMIDKVINYRMENLANGNPMTSFQHSTVYGLIELKKAVQKDNSILDIQPENIAQFSDMFVKELKGVNLTQHHGKSLEGFKYPSVNTIAKDITQNNKEDFYKSVTFYHLYQGGENNEYNRIILPKTNEWFNEPDSIKMLSEDISKTLQTNLRYDTLATTVLDNSDNDPKKAVKKLSDMVDNKPALKDDFIQAIAKGNLIYMDGLKINTTQVKELEETVKKEQLKLLEQKIENTQKRKVELQKPTMNNNKTS